MRPPKETPESIRRDAEKWKRALTDAAPVLSEESLIVYLPDSDKEPSREYLLSLVRDLDEAGVKIEYKGHGPVLTGNTEKLADETVRAIRKCKPFLVQVWAELKGRPPEAGPIMPSRGRRIEWIGMEYPENPLHCGETEGELLGLCDWVRWRYVGSRVWHSFLGFNWEE